MALKLTSPLLVSHVSSSPSYHHKNLVFLFLGRSLEPYSTLSYSKKPAIRAARASLDSSSAPHNDVAETNDSSSSSSCSSCSVSVVDDELISRVSRLRDASEVLEMIVDKRRDGGNGGKGGGGVLSCSDCCRIIGAALQCNNVDLALSVFAAMQSSSFDQVLNGNGRFVENWKWPRPDLSIYTTLVLGLAASLRVSDALKMVSDVCRVGASGAEEVPFGKIVRCPTCLIAVAVAQPQQGIQVCQSR